MTKQSSFVNRHVIIAFVDQQILRSHLIKLLEGNQAHMSFDDAIKKFPLKHINTKAPNVEYSFWHLLEHIRRTAADILEFMGSSKYREKEWPKDYWPDYSSTATKKDWDKTIRLIKKDLQTAITLSKSSKLDLFKKIPWGDGQTNLRELMLIADHNAYHIGEFAILRQVCKIW